MNRTYAEIFGRGGRSMSLGAWARPILVSTVFPAFTRAGIVRVAAIGAPGSGGKGGGAAASTTGSNSSPWGVKHIAVVATDILSIDIGAGGAPATVTGNGNPGNPTLVKLNGVTVMTCEPGEPGVQVASSGIATSPAASAVVVGADWWVPGLRAGSTTGTAAATGGAAVDVFRTGLGRSSDGSGARVGGSVAVSNGSTVLAPPPLYSDEFGLIFLGDPTAGFAGVAGITGQAGGMFAGGGGSTTVAGAGGRGAGGGGAGTAGTSSGAGGDGYAFVVFEPE